jgi:hypothetical protein
VFTRTQPITDAAHNNGLQAVEFTQRHLGAVAAEDPHPLDGSLLLRKPTLEPCYHRVIIPEVEEVNGVR